MILFQNLRHLEIALLLTDLQVVVIGVVNLSQKILRCRNKVGISFGIHSPGCVSRTIPTEDSDSSYGFNSQLRSFNRGCAEIARCGVRQYKKILAAVIAVLSW